MQSAITNPEETELFLKALAPDGQLTFQTFSDKKTRPDPYARILHGEFWQRRAALEKLNRKGAGAFVLVNRGDLSGRKVENVLAIRALFLDLDGAPLEPVERATLPPSIICESSPGRFHVFWPVSHMPLAAFVPAQKLLAARFNGDPTMADLARVIRLPGFVHHKGEPFTSRLLHCDPTMPWSWPQFAEAMELPLGGAPVNNKEEQWNEGMRNTRLFAFVCGLQNQGIEQNEAKRRARLANESQCSTPLGLAEVDDIFANAWAVRQKGYLKIENEVADSPAFRKLPHCGKVAMLALTRKYNGRNNGQVSLTRTEAKGWGLSKDLRAKAIKACEDANFVEYTQRGAAASPGRRASPDLFRLLWVT